MLGWKIFKHSMDMVTRNLGVAIRIALIPALIAIGAGVASMGIGTIAAAVGVSTNLAAGVMILLCIEIFVAIYRPTPILPVVAIGKPLTISQVWNATRGSCLGGLHKPHHLP